MSCSILVGSHWLHSQGHILRQLINSTKISVIFVKILNDSTANVRDQNLGVLLKSDLSSCLVAAGPAPIMLGPMVMSSFVMGTYHDLTVTVLDQLKI